MNWFQFFHKILSFRYLSILIYKLEYSMIAASLFLFQRSFSMNKYNCELLWYQKRENWHLILQHLLIASLAVYLIFKAWNLQKFVNLVNKIPHFDKDIIFRTLSQVCIPLYVRIKVKILKVRFSAHVGKFFLMNKCLWIFLKLKQMPNLLLNIFL